MNFGQWKPERVEKAAGVLLFLAIIYFPVFLHLSSFSLCMWDESLYALRALEISHNGEYLFNFNQFSELSDHPNTKPPLITLIQALFLKLGGYNVLSLRFPVAVFVLLTVLIIIQFCKKELQISLAGYFGGLVLLCSTGYISLHIARTGDHDAPLAFFTTLTLLNFYRFLKHEKKKSVYLLFSTLSLIAATFTKTVAGLMFIPSLLIYAIFTKKIRYIISSPAFYLCAMLYFTVTGTYFLLMEHLSPGYFSAVWDNDMGGRYSGTIDQHLHPFFFYFNNLVESRFIPWIFVLPLSGFLIFRSQNSELKRFSVFAGVGIVGYWLIISLARTKLLWYDAPLFPLMSTLVAIGIFLIYNHFISLEMFRSRYNRIIFLLLFIFAVYYSPYMTVIKSVYHYENNWRDEQLGDFMKKISPDIKQYTILLKNWNSHAVFYKEAYNINGYNITIKRFEDTFTSGEILMTCNSLDWSRKRFTYVVLDKYKDCRLIRINELTGKKENTN